MQTHPPRGFSVQEQNRSWSSCQKKKEKDKMAAYAIAYGFRLYTRKNISNHEEDYTWIEDNWYMSNGDYAMFEEILDKEF